MCPDKLGVLWEKKGKKVCSDHAFNHLILNVCVKYKLCFYILEDNFCVLIFFKTQLPFPDNSMCFSYDFA